MAIQTNAQNTYAMIGVREDLTDIVALIDPQETPFISNIGTGPKPTSTKHEWQVQPLASASKTNFQLEGDDTPSAASATARERLFNYTAISRKVGSVTGTAQEVEVAGIANELDNQKMLKAVELRRDMEVIVLDNNKYEVGGTSTVRECAGLATYITNGAASGAVYTGGANYTAATGNGSDAWNLGSTTTGALNLTALNSAVQDAHIDGGKPDMLMLSPRNKTAFSNITLQSSLGGAAPRCSSSKFDGIIVDAVGQHWRDFREPKWWKAQICQESQLNPQALSPVGAQGLAQIMPKTYEDIVRELKWDRAASAFDPSRAIHAGAFYQGKARRAWRPEGRTARERNDLGLCSYNAGAGNCIKAQALCGNALLWPAVSACLPKVTGEKNAHETQTYVQRIALWWSELEMKP